MRVAGVAIRAPVLATPVNIQAGIERNIWAVVVTNDALRKIAQKLGSGRGVILRVPVGIPLQRDLLEPVGRIDCGAPPSQQGGVCSGRI